MQTNQSKGDGRVGGWFLTYTGKQFWPLSARIEDLDIIDIAHGLSNVCRFGGHVNRFYSVAQHSVIVSHLVPTQYALDGLMHDATEAYMGDIVRPLKYQLPQYLEAEKNLERLVAIRYDLAFPKLPEVQIADDVALMTERRDLLIHTDHVWSVQAEPHPMTIEPQTPEQAEESFLFRFNELQSMRRRS